MRLYKPKQLPNQHRSRIDSSPDLPSSPPHSPTPHRLKRAAEAVSKQISGHKAMVAQFKQLRLPRTPMFTAQAEKPSQTDRPLSEKQSKGNMRPRMPQNVSARSPSTKAPISINRGQRAAVLSGSNTKSRSPTKPPGLNSFKKPSTLLSAPGKFKSVPSTTHSPSQTGGALPATSPTTLASPSTIPTTISTTSASDEIDIDELLLHPSYFQSLGEDPEPSYDPFETMDLSSGFETRISQIFGLGLGPASDKEIPRHDEIAPPTVTPPVTFVSALEPMYAAVEWWDQAETAALKRKYDGRPNGAEATLPHYKQDVCVPKNPPLPPLPSFADYEYVATLSRDPFRIRSLGIHKPSWRKYLITVTSHAIVKEEKVFSAILEEQRIMREVSGHPFLLGLMASFHDANGFYLVSELCNVILFDERDHMLESHKQLASAELACAVEFLHNLGIVHRNIKLDNVMLKDGHVVLGDFSLAHRLSVPQSLAPHQSGSIRVGNTKAVKVRGICGTLPYLAPEMLNNMPYSFGVDWFAYGVFLHVFYMDKFPWFAKHEHPASYLKEMMSTMSFGVISENGAFGELLNKLLCVDEDRRANFSVVRGASFFADFDWSTVIPSNPPVSSISRMLVGTEVAHSITPYDIDGDPYPGFTWINPSMIVDNSIPNICGSDLSPESSIAEPHTPSQFDAPAIEQSPVACGSFPLFDSFAPSPLYRHSTTFDFDSESHISEALPNAVDPLDEVFVPTSPASGNAAFEDSGICLGLETAVMPTDDYDEALVRTSIMSLDVGEEPIFNLPSGWKEAFVSTVDVTAPHSSKAGSTKKISVLPRFKSLWKRATSKFVSRSA